MCAAVWAGGGGGGGGHVGADQRHARVRKAATRGREAAPGGKRMQRTHGALAVARNRHTRAAPGSHRGKQGRTGPRLGVTCKKGAGGGAGANGCGGAAGAKGGDWMRKGAQRAH